MNTQDHILVTECPRDAMQGFYRNFSVPEKVEYINFLLECNFDYLDVVSFVSPKAIPQMANSGEVLERITQKDNSITGRYPKLIVITANRRGVEQAMGNKSVDLIGYPFSISEVFQQRNTNSSIQQTYKILKEVQELVVHSGKKLNIYISMGFGNNFNDKWDIDLTLHWIGKIVELGVVDVAIADTIGKANPDLIFSVAEQVSKEFPFLNPSFHLHSDMKTATQKIDAAIKGGIRKFDTAIGGFGGCPFAEDELVGNLSTEILLNYCLENNLSHNIDLDKFAVARRKAQSLFV